MSVQSPKRYRCTRCGHIQLITTNHYGSCWSWGRVNCCPNCPPYAKYSEFGGQTIWQCMDFPPMIELQPALNACAVKSSEAWLVIVSVGNNVFRIIESQPSESKARYAAASLREHAKMHNHTPLPVFLAFHRSVLANL